MTARVYTRCHRCGVGFGGPRSSPRCAECRDGQAYLWVVPYAPASFVAIPQDLEPHGRRP